MGFNHINIGKSFNSFVDDTLSHMLKDIGLGEVEEENRRIGAAICLGIMPDEYKNMNPELHPELYASTYYDLLPELYEEDIEEVAKLAEKVWRKPIATVERTLKSLKQKGLYQKNVDHLAQNEGFLNITELLSMLSTIEDAKGIDKFLDSEIPERIWINAIEITMCLYNKDQVKKGPDNYIFEIKEHIKELYVIAYFLWANEYQLKEFKEKQNKKTSKEPQKEKSHIKEKIEKKTRDLQQELENEKEKNKKEEERLKRELAKREKEIEHLKKLLKKKENIEKETEVEKPVDSPETAVEPQEISGEEYKKVVLPEKGVVFLGGHENLIKKLRMRHSEWKFVNKEGGFSFSATKTKLVFYYSEQISHGMAQHLAAKIPENTPLIYITGTNLERIEDQIKKGYYNYLNEENENRTVFSGK